MNRESVFRTARGLELPLIPPPQCKHCSSPIAEKWAKISGCCGFCFQRMKEQTSLFGRERPTLNPATLPKAGDVHPFNFTRAVAVGLYVTDAPKKGEFGRIVSDFKYHGKAGPDLAEGLDHILTTRAPLVNIDALVPLPPEPGNERDAPLVLARTLQARRGWPVVRALTLSPDYRSDKGATREAKFNATKGHFRVADAELIRGKGVALVDDIMTTGGHAHWAAKALIENGAGSVAVVVLARTFDVAALKAIGYTGRY